MSASLSGVFDLQSFTDAGVLGVGMRLYTYITGTTTFKAAYTDAAGLVSHTYTADGSGGQYIALNARGELPAPLYFSTGSYDLALKTAAGATVWTRRADPTADLLKSVVACPMDYGAVGDGATNDTAAFIAACNTGLLVDGRGKTYGISGSAQPSAFAGFVRGTLKQLAPATAAVRTLFLRSLSNFIIRDVTIDLGGLYTGGSMADCGGIWIDGTTPSGFVLDNVLVTNGGPGNGVSIQGASNFALINVRATEFYHNVGAIDDVVQGIWFNNCSSFTVTGGTSKNITGVSTVRYSRGMSFGGCSYFSIVGAECDTMDQCFDVTGTLGNHDYVFSACIAKAGGTFGFKAANSAYDARYLGCIASDCGLKSFVVSGQTEVANPLPHNIEFVGCKSRNAGSNGVWANAQGFRVESVPTINASYPRGVRFIDCEATDDQVTTTMTTAFANDVLPIIPTAADYNKNTVNTAVNCKAAWAGTPGVSFSGIHFPVVVATGTGTDSIPTSTWTSLSFGTDLENTAGMHNTAASNDVFYVKEPGLYEISVQVAFIANNAGLRQARFTVNGSAQPCIGYAGAHPTLATYLQHRADIRVDTPGAMLKVEAFQTSGITLTADRTQNFISIKKVG